MQQKALITLFVALVASPALSVPLPSRVDIDDGVTPLPTSLIGPTILTGRELEARRGKVSLSNVADASDVLANGIDIATNGVTLANQRRDVPPRVIAISPNGMEIFAHTRRNLEARRGRVSLSNVADASDVLANGIDIATNGVTLANQRRDTPDVPPRVIAIATNGMKIFDNTRRDLETRPKGVPFPDASDLANGIGIATGGVAIANQKRALTARRRSIAEAAEEARLHMNALGTTDVTLANQRRNFISNGATLISGPTIADDTTFSDPRERRDVAPTGPEQGTAPTQGA